MSNIASFMISFCSASILLGFLYMLCPTGNMEKSVKYVFCLCFLCSMLTVVSGLSKFDVTKFNFEKTNEPITAESAAVTAQTVFARVLTDENINFRKISVDTNKMTDGSIVISRVTVYSDESSQKITSLIGSDNYEVLIINE